MKLLLRSKENNSLNLVDTLDEPRYKEFYYDSEGGPLEDETVGTSVEDGEFTVAKTVVYPEPSEAKVKKTRKGKKTIDVEAN